MKFCSINDVEFNPLYDCLELFHLTQSAELFTYRLQMDSIISVSLCLFKGESKKYGGWTPSKPATARA